MRVNVPTYNKITANKIQCLNCEKILVKEDSSVEITITVWINGYMQIVSGSNFFCDDCSAKGFDIKPLIEDENNA